MRTTVDIDDPILAELKRLQKRERKPLGRLISDLLAVALDLRRKRKTPRASFRWISRPMGARVDLEDREAILDAMDESLPPTDEDSNSP
jgi:hypothetical protein